MHVADIVLDNAGLEVMVDMCLADYLTTMYNAYSVHACCRHCAGQCRIGDIVLDNAGLEVMVDMCLADYLTTMYNAARVRFHCKAIPWYVSDVMEKDFLQAIERLSNHTSACQQLAAKWKDYLEQGLSSFF
ncbi:hypothetical protein J6590_062429 [Homalodisca vitripennis]|nr:hypothetical protein J6590_062429 [Homalodisca vitripennis]